MQQRSLGPDAYGSGHNEELIGTFVRERGWRDRDSPMGMALADL